MKLIQSLCLSALLLSGVAGAHPGHDHASAAADIATMASVPATVVPELSPMANTATENADNSWKVATGLHYAALHNPGIDLLIAKNANHVFRLSHALNKTYELDVDQNDTTWHPELKLGYTILAYDFYPFSGGFRLSVGYARMSNNTLKLDVSGNSLKLDGKDYSQYVDRFGLDAKVNNGVYVGLGWGNGVRDRGLSTTFDIGFIKTTADANISLVCKAGAPQAQCDQALADANKEKDDLEDIFALVAGVHLKFGLQYRF